MDEFKEILAQSAANFEDVSADAEEVIADLEGEADALLEQGLGKRLEPLRLHLDVMYDGLDAGHVSGGRLLVEVEDVDVLRQRHVALRNARRAADAGRSAPASGALEGGRRTGPGGEGWWARAVACAIEASTLDLPEPFSPIRP